MSDSPDDIIELVLLDSSNAIAPQESPIQTITKYGNGIYGIEPNRPVVLQLHKSGQVTWKRPE